ICGGEADLAFIGGAGRSPSIRKLHLEMRIGSAIRSNSQRLTGCQISATYPPVYEAPQKLANHRDVRLQDGQIAPRAVEGSRLDEYSSFSKGVFDRQRRLGFELQENGQIPRNGSLKGVMSLDTRLGNVQLPGVAQNHRRWMRLRGRKDAPA